LKRNVQQESSDLKEHETCCAPLLGSGEEKKVLGKGVGAKGKDFEGSVHTRDTWPNRCMGDTRPTDERVSKRM